MSRSLQLLPVPRALLLVALILTAGWIADTPGLNGQAGGPPVIAPAPFNDFTVTDIEVSQGIQDLDNTMPLVAGRWTIVRVYVRDAGDLGANKVTARLTAQVVDEGQGGGGILAQPLNLPPGDLLPLNPGAAISIQAASGDRRDLDDSFWFFLPGAWHNAGGMLRLTAEVNPEINGGGGGGGGFAQLSPTVAEANHTNNTSSVEVKFNRADPVRIRYVPLHLHQNWDVTQPAVGYTCARPDFWEITWVSLRFLPAAGVQVQCTSNFLEPLSHGGINGQEWDMSDPTQCLLANERLSWLKTQENPNGTWHYIGMIDPSLGGLCNN